jgi:hypothetical protein
MPIEEEVTDIAEITQLLSNTNELLNRSSHLRASLTVSVRHANKKTGQTATFLFPAKKKEGSKKSKNKKMGLWNNLMKKSREDLSVDSDVEQTSSGDSSDAYESVAAKSPVHAPGPVPERTRYEEANARIAAKFEKSRENDVPAKETLEPVTSPEACKPVTSPETCKPVTSLDKCEPVTSSDDDFERVSML